MFLRRLTNATTSSRGHFNSFRRVAAGCFPRETPGLHSVKGRIGRRSKPPPQFGQTLKSTCSTQSAQKVHSYVHILASSALGDSDLPHHSQFGLSSSIKPASTFAFAWVVPGVTDVRRIRNATNLYVVLLLLLNTPSICLRGANVRLLSVVVLEPVHWKLRGLFREVCNCGPWL